MFEATNSCYVCVCVVCIWVCVWDNPWNKTEFSLKHFHFRLYGNRGANQSPRPSTSTGFWLVWQGLSVYDQLPITSSLNIFSVHSPLPNPDIHPACVFGKPRSFCFSDELFFPHCYIQYIAFTSHPRMRCSHLVSYSFSVSKINLRLLL